MTRHQLWPATRTHDKRLPLSFDLFQSGTKSKQHVNLSPPAVDKWDLQVLTSTIDLAIYTKCEKSYSLQPTQRPPQAPHPKLHPAGRSVYPWPIWIRVRGREHGEGSMANHPQIPGWGIQCVRLNGHARTAIASVYSIHKTDQAIVSRCDDHLGWIFLIQSV